MFVLQEPQKLQIMYESLEKSIPESLKVRQKGSFQNIFLDASHVGLVNEQWNFGKNGRSLKYIECCLQNFPGFGVLGPEGDTVSWTVTEQSCEMRMDYTVPKPRPRLHEENRFSLYILFRKKMPFNLHVSKDKENLQPLR
ncbi:hypothetical protein GH733_007474, partial [Mirounga leonina]